MGVRNQKGMTLIELIVSIAILAIIIVPVLGMLSASSLNNSNARAKTANGAVGQAVMEYYKKTSINSISRPATLYIFRTKDGINNNPGFSHNKIVSGVDSVNSFSQIDSIASTIPGAKPYDYAVRVTLTNAEGSGSLAEISVTVYDSFNKDNNKIIFTSLRGIN